MFRTNEEHNAEKKFCSNLPVFNRRGRRERRVLSYCTAIIRSVIVFSSMFVFLCVTLRPLRFIFPVSPPQEY